MSPKKILVVEDEPEVLERFSFVLSRKDIEVITAANGLEGLGAVKAQDPDLVLLDAMLPGENGYRIAKMI